MFTYLFGGALAGSVNEYVQVLIPGILVMTVAMISMYTAIGINTDITKGIFDRFRSLPFWRPAVLVGALLGDLVRYTIAATVVIVLGVILGFRPDGGIIGVFLGWVLLMFFAFSLSWIWTMLGLLMNDPESVMMTCGIASFPLTFLTNIFVDPVTMPSMLQKFVSVNPITLVVTAVRGLMHGTVTSGQMTEALLGCVVIIVIFAPISMYLYNNKNTH
jgi:ABC-2 type transport system permease protein